MGRHRAGVQPCRLCTRGPRAVDFGLCCIHAPVRNLTDSPVSTRFSMDRTSACTSSATWLAEFHNVHDAPRPIAAEGTPTPRFGNGCGRRRPFRRPRWRERATSTIGRSLTLAFLLVSVSCTTEWVPPKLGADHPASREGKEAPPATWATDLPLGDSSSAQPTASPDAAPSKPDASASPGAQPGQVLYTCPMHPQIVSDKPGRCPICNMKLVEKKSDGHEHGGRQ